MNGLAFAVVVMAMASACGKPPTASGQPPPEDGHKLGHAVVVFLPDGRSESRVQVELAVNDEERQRGLMYRKELGPDAGMLFLFDVEEEQGFWMKNTLIPLDMIFVTHDMTVAGVVENAEPQTLSSRTVGLPSQYVVEVNGGWASAHGVTAGTAVRFEGVKTP